MFMKRWEMIDLVASVSFGAYHQNEKVEFVHFFARIKVLSSGRHLLIQSCTTISCAESESFSNFHGNSLGISQF